MKTGLKELCLAAVIAAVSFLGGAAAVLILKHCRDRRACCPSPYVCAEEPEADGSPCGAADTEAK